MTGHDPLLAAGKGLAEGRLRQVQSPRELGERHSSRHFEVPVRYGCAHDLSLAIGQLLVRMVLTRRKDRDSDPVGAEGAYELCCLLARSDQKQACVPFAYFEWETRPDPASGHGAVERRHRQLRADPRLTAR